MKPSKIRDQSVQELENERTRLEEQIFKLRFQNAVGQLDNPLKIRTVRRDLARVRTIMNEKLRAQASAPATEG
ncbi:MAG: 50S ribosomal protein L29 [Acidobacteria bacterium]|jgi:large subunit ribosomal protein L29|nr:MAG: 50S ribosomal protein L29 [Acidobacteriota bacterium]